ncbi:hypothetical protein BT69DRAFT_1283238 [Atractiella rhizophila]|nr:hypothetical protein BT69DRAFT_1283238 [Atractiella rhizophila]
MSTIPPIILVEDGYAVRIEGQLSIWPRQDVHDILARLIAIRTGHGQEGQDTQTMQTNEARRN